MKINKIKISLICISAIFFFMWVVLSMDYPSYSGTALTVVAAQFLSVISLFGSILFLLEMKNRSNRWYLGVPLCIAILIAVITMFFFYMYHFLLSTSLAILAPCSVLFFFSVPADRRKMMTIPVLISRIISIYALFSYYYLLMGTLSPLQTSWNVVDGMSVLYWVIGMPIIGICFMVIAIIYKEDITRR